MPFYFLYLDASKGDYQCYQQLLTLQVPLKQIQASITPQLDYFTKNSTCIDFVQRVNRTFNG